MTLLNTLILAAYSAGALGAVAALVSKRAGLFRLAAVAMVAGFALHTADLGMYIWHEGHLPLFGLQEITSFVSWALVLYFLIVQMRYQTSALAGLLFPTALALEFGSVLAPAIP